MASALAGVIGVFVLQALIALAGRARAKTANGRTVYGVILPGKIIFAAGIVILGGLPILILLRGDDWRATLLFLPFFLLCVFGLPGPIVVDPVAGISMRRWYSGVKRIGWHEIVRMDWTDEMQQTTVVSTDGRKIIHTGFHADRDDFRRQISTLAQPPAHAAG